MWAGRVGSRETGDARNAATPVLRVIRIARRPIAWRSSMEPLDGQALADVATIGVIQDRPRNRRMPSVVVEPPRRSEPRALQRVPA